MSNYRINIASDFTDTPGGRYENKSSFSGEAFRKKILAPKYLEAKAAKVALEIDFDGAYGYPTSFLEEAFGGLARIHKVDVEKDFLFISTEQPSLVDVIKKYMKDA